MLGGLSQFFSYFAIFGERERTEEIIAGPTSPLRPHATDQSDQSNNFLYPTSLFFSFFLLVSSFVFDDDASSIFTRFRIIAKEQADV